MLVLLLTLLLTLLLSLLLLLFSFVILLSGCFILAMNYLNIPPYDIYENPEDPKGPKIHFICLKIQTEIYETPKIVWLALEDI